MGTGIERRHRVSARTSEIAGFSLVEMLAVVAVIAIMAAVAIPGMQSEVAGLKLGIATRDVQSELQRARLKAVSSNSYMRVRFNCPVAGQFRMVEQIGSALATDAGDDTNGNSVTRCGDFTKYPYKATGPDQDRLSKPNNDGPIRYLQSGITLTIAGIPDPTYPVVEFAPDGSALIPPSVACPANTICWARVPNAGSVVITLSKGTQTKTVTVTSAGNVQMQR